MTQNPQFMKRIQPLYSAHSRIVSVQAGRRYWYPTQLSGSSFKPGTRNNEFNGFNWLMGGLRWLFTGDLDQAGEREILTTIIQLYGQTC